MKKAVLFDLDGTLMDTSIGIFNCVRYAQGKMALSFLSEERYREFIGPPPHETYQRLFGLSPKEATTATAFHREYALEKGVYEAKVYDGIQKLLAELKQNGFKLGVATYKRHDLAVLILEHFGIAGYFDVINGCDNENKLSKTNIIEKCIEELELIALPKTDRLIYIGDSEYDAIAANEIGAEFIGVTYGFGFASKEDIDRFPNIGSANSVPEIIGCILV